MIDPRHPVLSIVRQCALIGMSRSAWYKPGRTETPLNLALMKLIDAQFMETPFYGSRKTETAVRTSRPLKNVLRRPLSSNSSAPSTMSSV